jgi:hypothetical protein
MAETKIDEFAFVLLAGLVLIIVMMVSFTTPQKPSNASTSVTATIPPITETARFFNLGDFTVSYSLGTDTLASKKNVEVSRGISSEKHVNLIGVTTNDKLAITTSGFIEILVEDTNGAGSLIVELNGNEVFNKVVGPGKVAIPLTKDQINDSNVVAIKAGGPGWRFWMSAVYQISSAKLGINFQGINFKTFNIVLTNDEISKFNFGEISFRVKSSSQAKNDLVIKINDKTIFGGIPSTNFVKQFGNEIYLSPDVNNVTFSVERTASYDLADVVLKIVRST